MQHRPIRIAVIASLLLLASCGIALPEDKADYAGEWRSAEMSLRITRDGRVEYRRSRGKSSTTVEGPLQTFEGDEFSVGLSFMTTRFDVSVPPHEEDDHWYMTVDGVRLQRIAR
ncbi:MAG: hypothetical protein IPG63_18680 [Xanthomonadales bacterium]|nr:hypothetical protein [Xanthomonadales bacterium]MBK7144761.1 hypothetical protein [Xanthomonadales bacterium]MCC6561619.1 hypothetical protein [Xanthomonadales bacterium]